MRISLIMAAILTGCGLMPPVQVQTNFNINDYKAYTTTGNGKLQGQAFLKQNGGGVVTCAGNEVRLLPDTQYFREVISIAQSRRKVDPSSITDEVKSVIKRTICDAGGNFEINDLPEARYIVLTKVNWQVGYTEQGDALLEYVEIKGTAPIKVILTDANRALK